MAFNGILDSAKGAFDKAKGFFQEKIPGVSKKPDIVIKENYDFLQIMGKFCNSIKIQFKEFGERISKSSIAKDVKKEWEKGLSGKMFACICAIFASPVISVGLFIESIVELIKAACNFYDANAEAIKKQSY